MPKEIHVLFALAVSKTPGVVWIKSNGFDWEIFRISINMEVNMAWYAKGGALLPAAPKQEGRGGGGVIQDNLLSNLPVDSFL